MPFVVCIVFGFEFECGEALGGAVDALGVGEASGGDVVAVVLEGVPEGEEGWGGEGWWLVVGGFEGEEEVVVVEVGEEAGGDVGVSVSVVAAEEAAD